MHEKFTSPVETLYYYIYIKYLVNFRAVFLNYSSTAHSYDAGCLEELTLCDKLGYDLLG